MRDVFAVGAVCMLAPALMASNKFVVVVSFFVFEVPAPRFPDPSEP